VSTKWVDTDIKVVMVGLVIIFEIGSIVCATAPSSKALIVGRAITGIGGAGISSGALILINILVPLSSRPKYSGKSKSTPPCFGSLTITPLGGIGAMFGLASVIGPLVGGYLTAITWRWCFWINVPIGGVAVIVLILLCPNRPPPSTPASTLYGKVKQLDPIGFLLIAPGIVCLLFALQWGGTKYSWGDGHIIALFAMAGVLCLAFVASQMWLGDHRTIPARIITQRTMIAASFASIGIGSIMVVYSFYLPVWFQGIQGKSPQSAGLSLLPLLLSQVVLVIAGGIVTTICGYYTPLLILGGVVSIVGSALITTWDPDTGTGKWIGYQVSTERCRAKRLDADSNGRSSPE
jgi:MFS family permease